MGVPPHGCVGGVETDTCRRFGGGCCLSLGTVAADLFPKWDQLSLEDEVGVSLVEEGDTYSLVLVHRSETEEEEAEWRSEDPRGYLGDRGDYSVGDSTVSLC